MTVLSRSDTRCHSANLLTINTSLDILKESEVGCYTEIFHVVILVLQSLELKCNQGRQLKVASPFPARTCFKAANDFG